MPLIDDMEAIFRHEVGTIKNPYIINRMMSSIPQTVLLSIRINRYIGNVPSWGIKGIYFNSIKKRKGLPSEPKHYWKKKGKDVELTKRITRHLCCSEMHAKETITLLRKMKAKPEKFFGLKKGA